jgi:hypothetical protein
MDEAALMEMSIMDMTDEEFEAWLAIEDPDPPPPSEWPLDTYEGRYGFLESYMWRGEIALFESVTHIWNLLNEPKDARCIGIGLAAGTGGTGKWALAKFLRHALHDALHNDIRPPWGQKFGSLDETHNAAMSYFEADYAHYERAVQKYADILGGESGRHASLESQLIQGPWRALLQRPEVRPEARQNYVEVMDCEGRTYRIAAEGVG